MAKTAKDIMTRHPQTVTPETTVQQAAQLMKSEDTGVLPVVESSGSKRPVGVITDRDITLRVVAEGRTGGTVREAMTSSVRTAKEDDDLKSVMQVMADEQVRRMPVVDDRGELVGIIALADLVLEADDKQAERTIEAISQPGR